MSGLLTYPAPSRTFALVRALVAHLKADAQLIDWLQGEHVYSHRVPKVDGRPDRLIVVRETLRPSTIRPGRVVNAVFQVMSWTGANTPPNDLQAWHWAVQEHARRIIVGKGTPDDPLPMGPADLRTGVQLSRVTEMVAYDDDFHADFLTWDYRASLLPLAE